MSESISSPTNTAGSNENPETVWVMFEGMDQAAIEEFEYGDPPDDLVMIVQLKGGDTTIVGFCERQCDHNTDTLRQFIIDHSQFESWIQPIIDDDPEWADGDICFKRIGVNTVQAKCQTEVTRLKGEYNYEITVTLDQYMEFVRLIEPIGALMIEGGELALNI